MQVYTHIGYKSFFSDWPQALRGAADSFGIVTTFYLATKPAPAEVVQWSFNFANIYSSITTATNIFLHVQNFARDATIIDRNIGFSIYLDAGGLVITGTYFGSLEIFNTKVNDTSLDFWNSKMICSNCCTRLGQSCYEGFQLLPRTMSGPLIGFLV